MLARSLITAGILFVALGLLVWAGQSVPWLRFGRLPGDIRIERSGFTFYFPLTTMALLSAAATGAFYLAGRLRK